MRLGHLIHRYQQTNRYPQAVGPPHYPPPGPSEHPQNQAKQTERLCRELGDKEGLAYSLGSQAWILQERRDLDGAMALHKEAENTNDPPCAIPVSRITSGFKR